MPALPSRAEATTTEAATVLQFVEKGAQTDSVVCIHASSQTEEVSLDADGDIANMEADEILFAEADTEAKPRILIDEDRMECASQKRPISAVYNREEGVVQPVEFLPPAQIADPSWMSFRALPTPSQSLPNLQTRRSMHGQWLLLGKDPTRIVFRSRPRVLINTRLCLETRDLVSFVGGDVFWNKPWTPFRDDDLPSEWANGVFFFAPVR